MSTLDLVSPWFAFSVHLLLILNPACKLNLELHEAQKPASSFVSSPLNASVAINRPGFGDNKLHLILGVLSPLWGATLFSKIRFLACISLPTFTLVWLKVFCPLRRTAYCLSVQSSMDYQWYVVRPYRVTHIALLDYSTDSSKKNKSAAQFMKKSQR